MQKLQKPPNINENPPTYGYCWVCDTMLSTLDTIPPDPDYFPTWELRPDLALRDFPQSLMAYCGFCTVLDQDKEFISSKI
jgi:hypothetical protein